ncbi:MAG TPA: transaldolase [Gammaproteobacteria bacterium]|nr:transaldolase [Gammaproteobacteria bacterium]
MDLSAAKKPTQRLQDLGQSLWLDNIDRKLLRSGALRRYIDAMSVTGLTSNPTIFDKAIGDSDAYDAAIRKAAPQALSTEALFFDLALQDLTEAAKLFEPVFDASKAMDGWVSLEISPLLADDTAGSVQAAVELHARVKSPNLFMKIPGTAAGVPAIEEAIFKGVPVNVTLLFSREQYLAAAEAYQRGIQRRMDAGLDPRVHSVASLFVSRWDVAVAKQVPAELVNRLGIAVSQQVYRAYCELHGSSRWRTLASGGALKQKLLWASTGTKDPQASDTLYVEALAAPDTINTMPEKTLQAFAEHGRLRGVMAPDGGDSRKVLDAFTATGIDIPALAGRLQQEGTAAFTKSWHQLMHQVAEKSKHLKASAA